MEKISFSDEDLKRLKDAAKSERWEGSLVALIARLEAAETVCQILIEEKVTWWSKPSRLVEAWLKSKEPMK